MNAPMKAKSAKFTDYKAARYSRTVVASKAINCDVSIGKDKDARSSIIKL